MVSRPFPRAARPAEANLFSTSSLLRSDWSQVSGRRSSVAIQGPPKGCAMCNGLFRLLSQELTRTRYYALTSFHERTIVKTFGW